MAANSAIDSLYELTAHEMAQLRNVGLVAPNGYYLPHGQRQILGTVSPKEGGDVNVWVTAMPARFWEFEVKTLEGHKFKVDTGSGDFEDFWSSVLLMAGGMFNVSESE
jgi:hypothetical protein